MSSTTPTDGLGDKSVLLILSGWACIASAAGVAGWLERVTAPMIAGIVWALTILVLIACWKILSLQAWVMNVDLRWLVRLHLVRFVGIYFLILSSRGQLPFAFAAPAGVGDILVAILAVILLVVADTRNWSILILWNTIGLTDILFVVLLALRLGLADWQSMHALREFPLSLLPTVIVPLIIASHVLIYLRAVRLKRATPGQSGVME